MLPARRRLRASEVREVIQHGRSVRGSLVSVKSLPASTPLKAAAVVSKKVAKTAVLRNSVRRALYRALQDTKATGSIVIFVHKIPQKPRSLAFRDELMVLLSKR